MSNAFEQFEAQVDNIVGSGDPEYEPWMSEAADVILELMDLEGEKDGISSFYLDLSCLFERVMTWLECARVFQRNSARPPITDAVKLEAAACLNALAAEFGLERGCVWDPDTN